MVNGLIGKGSSNWLWSTWYSLIIFLSDLSIQCFTHIVTDEPNMVKVWHSMGQSVLGHSMPEADPL